MKVEFILAGTGRAIYSAELPAAPRRDDIVVLPGYARHKVVTEPWWMVDELEGGGETRVVIHVVAVGPGT